VLLTLKFFAVRALEGLQFTGPDQDILRDIWQGTKQPKEEPVARATQELQKLSTRSLRSTEWWERDGLLYYCSCIYVPDTSDLRCRIVSLCHDTKVAGHPGRFKTLELVSRSYWWPNMSRYVGMYVSHCDLCLRTKIQCRLPTGELQLLPIPEECWDVISVDFISELLESGGYNSIMVAVDSTGKRSHFVETVTTVTATGVANLYLQNVWKLHGLPRTAIPRRLHEGAIPTARNRSRDIYRLPPTDRQTDRTGQPGTGTVPADLRQRKTGQLVHTPPPGGVLLQ